MKHSFDLHVHTVHSGDSPCRVKEAIESAKEKNLSGIAITDHNSVDALTEVKKLSIPEDFLVIPGIEISSKDGHILALGIKEEIESYLSASETVEKIKEKGGIAIAAHPFSLSDKPFSPLKAEFDAIEVYNPRRYIGNFLAKKYAVETNANFSAGSDSHYKEEIGLAGVEIDCKLEIENVLDKIKEGDVEIFGKPLPLSGFLRRLLFRTPL